MTLARALALFAGFLALDALAAFVLLVVGGLLAPKGTGTGLSVVLGGVLLASLLAFGTSAALYLRLLFAAEPVVSGRWFLGALFVLASLLLYFGMVVVTLVAFNR